MQIYLNSNKQTKTNVVKNNNFFVVMQAKRYSNHVRHLLMIDISVRFIFTTI